MSLDVYLHLKGATTEKGSGIFIRENGATREISRSEWDEKFPGAEPFASDQDGEDDCVFEANITHNLGRMAREAGIYEQLWRPDEIGMTGTSCAKELIAPLAEGLAKLLASPEHYKRFNPENGWGDYEGLVSFVQKYLDACIKYPDAEVSVSR